MGDAPGLKDALRRLDVDGDGYLSKEAFKDVRRALALSPAPLGPPRTDSV